MLKSLLIEPLKDFHNKVKEEVEDNTINIRQVAPGPDTQMFEIQQSELQETLKLRASKRGKSEAAAKTSLEPYDPNAVKEWGDSVSQVEIKQRAAGLISGEALEQKKREYVNKKETAELILEDRKNSEKIGSKASQKLEEQIQKKKEEQRAQSINSKDEN